MRKDRMGPRAALHRVIHDSGATPHTDMTLRDEARERAAAARTDRDHARTMARRHQAVHYVTGGGAALAGAAGGAAGLFGDDPTAAGILGFAASAFVGLQALFRGQKYADHHWSRNAGLGRLAQDYEALVNAPEEPTQRQLSHLAARWEKLHQPPGGE
jgi:hypothetical protein